MAYTTITKASAHFNNIIWTGDGNATRSFTGVGFRPDLIWTKNRSATDNHGWIDSVRGVNLRISSSTTASTITSPSSGYLSSFDSDGFSVQAGSSSTANFNTNSENYASWAWLAGGTAPTKTYKVVVVSDSGNKYRFRNSGDTATFGASAVTLDLQEGGTYTFDVSDSTLNSHPFVIGTAANSSEYSTGVTYKLDGVTKTYSQYTSGFSAATSRQLIITLAASAPALYYWCSQHSGMGGAINTNSTFGSSNFDGNVQSLVSVNSTAGFSIVKYTGDGSGSGTIGHGLGATPDVTIMRPLNYTGAWWIAHKDLSTDNLLEFNANNQAAYNSFGGGGLRYSQYTSSVIAGGNGSSNSDLWNKSSEPYIAYCFSEKQGFSKFGSYSPSGGGGTDDGPFIYTGFAPKLLIIKNNHTGSRNWVLYDDKRESTHHKYIQPTLNNAEGDAAALDVRLLSNGFKVQGANGEINTADGVEYTYYAWGQSLVGTNNVPTTAR
jgi:hypothetical protein